MGGASTFAKAMADRRCAGHKLHKKVSEGIGRSVKVSEGSFFMVLADSHYGDTRNGTRRKGCGIRVLPTFHARTMQAARCLRTANVGGDDRGACRVSNQNEN